MMKFPLLYCTLLVSGLLFSNNSEAQIFKKINDALNKANQSQTDSTKKDEFVNSELFNNGFEQVEPPGFIIK